MFGGGGVGGRGRGLAGGDEEICLRRERLAEKDVCSERPNVVLIE